MRLPRKLIKRITSADFTIDIDGNEIEFGKYSPEGQDFRFTVEAKNLNELADNVMEQYESYDVSYETHLWLDNCGHGQNGAPYDMQDVYRDMQSCKDSIMKIYDIINDYITEEE